MNIRIVLRKIKATILELIKGKYLEEPHLIFELYNKKSNGTMIDVGAHFGSALMPFAKNGWQVLGFEPDPNNRQVVLANTSTFKNVTIFDQAVSNIFR